MFGLVMLTSLVDDLYLPIQQRSAAESLSSQRHPESLELESRRVINLPGKTRIFIQNHKWEIAPSSLLITDSMSAALPSPRAPPSQLRCSNLQTSYSHQGPPNSYGEDESYRVGVIS